MSNDAAAPPKTRTQSYIVAHNNPNEFRLLVDQVKAKHPGATFLIAISTTVLVMKVQAPTQLVGINAHLEAQVETQVVTSAYIEVTEEI